MKTTRHITGIILAGGKSSRMGQDKALLSIEGTTFLAKIAHVLKPFVQELIIVSDHQSHDTLGFKRVEDHIKNTGPLAGLYSGLTASNTTQNIVLSCDTPFVSTRLIETLLEQSYSEASIHQIAYQSKVMPLIATYKSDCLPIIEMLLNKGERRLRSLSEHLKTHQIEVDHTFKLAIENINTPQQYNTLIHGYHH